MEDVCGNRIVFSDQETKQDYASDPRLQAVKNVLGMLTDEGGKIFSPSRLDEIGKIILFWIDEVK